MPARINTAMDALNSKYSTDLTNDRLVFASDSLKKKRIPVTSNVVTTKTKISLIMHSSPFI